MSNPIGTCTTLQDAGGIFIDCSSAQVLGVALKSALTGSLTITGVNNLDGSPSSWVIAPASTGWQAPTGNSAGLCARTSFTYSNPGADAGKAVACWVPR